MNIVRLITAAFSLAAWGTTVFAAFEVPLSAVIDPYEADAEGARPMLDRNVLKGPLKIAGREFSHGVGVQVNSSIALAVNGARRLVANVGVDDIAPANTSVAFEVRGDGRSLWRGVARTGQSAVPIDVDLAGIKIVVLVED